MRSIGAPAVSDEPADEEDEDYRGGDEDCPILHLDGRLSHDRFCVCSKPKAACDLTGLLIKQPLTAKPHFSRALVGNPV